MQRPKLKLSLSLLTIAVLLASLALAEKEQNFDAAFVQKDIAYQNKMSKSRQASTSPHSESKQRAYTHEKVTHKEEPLNSNDELIAQAHGTVYRGEPFLSQQTHSFTDLFYELTGVFSFNIWDGFLSGLYKERNNGAGEQAAAAGYQGQADVENITLGAFLMKETCLGDGTNKYIRSVVQLAENTSKEVFFINLAGVLRDMAQFVVMIRQNCYFDQLVKDIIKFCSTQCEPQKLMSRFAVNIKQMAPLYTELLTILFDKKTQSLHDEALKVQEIGEKLGKIVRIAVGFDLFDRYRGQYAEYYEEDDDEEDFV